MYSHATRVTSLTDYRCPQWHCKAHRRARSLCILTALYLYSIFGPTVRMVSAHCRPHIRHSAQDPTYCNLISVICVDSLTEMSASPGTLEHAQACRLDERTHVSSHAQIQLPFTYGAGRHLQKSRMLKVHSLWPRNFDVPLGGIFVRFGLLHQYRPGICVCPYAVGVELREKRPNRRRLERHEIHRNPPVSTNKLPVFPAQAGCDEKRKPFLALKPQPRRHLATLRSLVTKPLLSGNPLKPLF